MASNDKTITLRLSKDSIFRLAMEAHDEGVTLQAYIQRIVLQRVEQISTATEFPADRDGAAVA